MNEQEMLPNHSELAKSLATEVKSFVDTFVIPNEALLMEGGEEAHTLQAELMTKARHHGLWGLYYPLSHGGKLASLEDYLVVAEQEGRSEFSQEVFGSHFALDAHMLLKFGSDAVRNDFLTPLSNGDVIPSYAMTETDHGGSIPALINTTAQHSDGQWVINGHKWFICNAAKASFVTVLVRTAAKHVSTNQALSMIVVPTDSDGFKVEGQVDIMGRSLGQGEISFNNVRVPMHNLLGQEGNGIALMEQRLSIGRLLRSMHWVGLAQRCFDLMGQRVYSPRGQSTRLAEKQLVRQHFVNVYRAISSARELIRIAARGVDQQRASMVEIGSAKMAASHCLCQAADSAIQLYGAEGVSDLTPLSGIYRMARTTRILDGSDEALTSAIGRRLVAGYKTADEYDFVNGVFHDTASPQFQQAYSA